jgi:alpha-tubulin suppressor-like RCC1 family protein
MKSTRIACLLLLVPLGCGSEPQNTSGDDAHAPPNDSSGVPDGSAKESGQIAPDASLETSPRPLEGGSDAVSPDPVIDVAAGGQFSCVVYSSGSVSCWGSDLGGQLGVDPTTLSTCSSPSEVTFGCRSSPAKVPGLVDVVHVEAGLNDACALTAKGDVYCWGLNDDNQLGHAAGSAGDATCALEIPTPCNWTPSKVEGLGSVKQLAMGDRSVCALSAGQVYCWGNGDWFALGLGNVDDASRVVPTLVPSLPGDITEIASSTIATHVCALSPSEGVFCWGSNEDGELGHAPGAGSPADTGYTQEAGWGNGTAQVVAQTTGMTSLVAGAYMTCAIASGGQVMCWGDNGMGQLGTGAWGYPASAPTASLVTGAATLTRSSHAPVCSLTTTGAMSCWGPTDTGEVGIGAYNEMPTSVTTKCDINEGQYCVPTPQTIAGLTVARASTGEDFDFLFNFSMGGHVLALTLDGQVYGWGTNLYGEAGHAPSTDGDAMCFAESTTTSAGVPCAPVPVLVEGL